MLNKRGKHKGVQIRTGEEGSLKRIDGHPSSAMSSAQFQLSSLVAAQRVSQTKQQQGTQKHR